MTDEFSGEQKLRIVLESIIRNVPKEEQSKKYGVSEAEFQKWHDHLIQNGGKLFESTLHERNRVPRTNKKKSNGTKVFLILSIFINLTFFTLISYLVLLKDVNLESLLGSKTDQIVISEQGLKNNFVKTSNDTENYELLPEINHQESEEQFQIKKQDLSSIEDSEKSHNPEIVRINEDFPKKPNILPPLENLDLPKDVTFLGNSYDGRHVVYLLDVGTYVLDGENAVSNFQKVKKGLVSSILSLSPNSYFNLVMYWNLREVSALGPTILKATKENKKYAEDWINSLGDTKDSLKVERNQYYPKEVLYTKPGLGIVGPWYALSTAISFDPDLVFVISGNTPGFNRSEVPRSHYEGLGRINIDPLTTSSSVKSSISPVFKETAKKWYYSITPIGSLPDNEFEVEKLALAKLGLSGQLASQPIYQELPWDKTFDNFISSLEVGFDQIPKTHFLLSLPPYTSWPTSLTNSAREFAESSRGSFQDNLFQR